MEQEKIIDWEYYSSHFPAPVPETAFEAVEEQSEIELRNIVPNYKLESMPEEKVKNLVFQICNFLYTNQSVISGSAVTSVNNNGYSESYAIQTPEQARDALEDLILDGVGRLAGAY